MSFTLSLDAINDSKKWSFHFCIPQTVDTPMSYKTTTSLQFPLFSSVGPCEYNNKPLGYIKCQKFLD
jgi:hypothetical protein